MANNNQRVYVFRVERAPNQQPLLVDVRAKTERAARLKALNETASSAVIVELVEIIEPAAA